MPEGGGSNVARGRNGRARPRRSLPRSLPPAARGRLSVGRGGGRCHRPPSPAGRVPQGGGRKRGPGTKAGLHVDAVPGSTYRHSRDPSSQPPPPPPPPPPPEGLHSQWQETHSWMTPLWREAAIHGLTGWKAKPLTRADLDSNLVSMVPGGGVGQAGRSSKNEIRTGAMDRKRRATGCLRVFPILGSRVSGLGSRGRLGSRGALSGFRVRSGWDVLCIVV